MTDAEARAMPWLTEQLKLALRAMAHLVGTVAGDVARAATTLETILDPDWTGAPPSAGGLVSVATAPTPAPVHPDDVERLVGLLNRAVDVVIVLDVNSTVVYANEAVERALGYPRSEVIGMKGLDLLHPDDAPIIQGTLATLMARPEGSATFEYRVLHQDGTWRWFEAIAMNWLDDPEVGGLVINARDVSERRRYEEDLRHRALHDTLTGLPNRTLLFDRLDGAISRAGRETNAVAVFFLDLDDFKLVNDSLGHSAGDDVLVGAAKRLAAAARAEDTVARFGGDEFVVVLEHNQDPEWVTLFAERLRHIFSRPFQAGHSMATVTASIGIAIATGNHSNPEGLLRDADTAMYRAKQSGGNSYVVFDDSMLDEPVIDLPERARQEIRASESAY